MKNPVLLALIVLGLSACIPNNKLEKDEKLEIASLSDTLRYKKILGAMVGSAAGDAMGAPVEMWSRDEIQAQYGFIDSLVDLVRDPSAEGPWDFNPHLGGTTDDTRWKVLMADYFLEEVEDYPCKLSAKAFAQFIRDRMDTYWKQIKEIENNDPKAYEDSLQKMFWLEQWVIVSEGFLSESKMAHFDSLSQFYGGEMVCAGVLFAPSVGMLYPGAPEFAYQEAYDIDIFDLGYARDIAGLSAAMVSAAMVENATPKSIEEVLWKVDPQKYFKGRLIGRTSFNLYKQAKRIALEVSRVKPEEYLKNTRVKLSLPLRTKADSLKYAQWAMAYDLLDTQTRMYPFHPAEIHLVCLTALLIGEYDFREVMAFIVNFGRDNDTTAALAGAILGAYYGIDGIPKDIREPVIIRQKEMGVDIEAIAKKLSEKMKVEPRREKPGNS
ncbi:MAG: ADP-ribosylglycohydrolase family protein [Bacteroidia bacterium]|nr:ADP-ribosylglycohydrolase family protein [Bacteroidia bacterium]